MSAGYPTNRDRVKEQRRGKGWCLCDQAKVSHQRKCPLCRRTNGRRRFKRTPAP